MPHSPPLQLTGQVLIVDDEPALSELLALYIRSLGLHPLPADSAEAALKLLDDQQVDLILLDHSLGGLSGVELCRILRKRPDTALAPILVVTACADEEMRVAAFEAGADDFIARPYSGRELCARVWAHLKLAQERIELSRLNGVLATIRLVSHEFNNPLQSVVGGLQLMEMAREGGQINEGEAMEMIADGARRLHELANRLVQITSPSFKPSPIGSMLDIEESV